MAMTYAEFVKASGAQVVGGRLVVGERLNRRFVGSMENGTFNLNEAGQALQEELEAAAREVATRIKPPKKVMAEAKVATEPLPVNDDLDFTE